MNIISYIKNKLTGIKLAVLENGTAKIDSVNGFKIAEESGEQIPKIVGYYEGDYHDSGEILHTMLVYPFGPTVYTQHGTDYPGSIWTMFFDVPIDDYDVAVNTIEYRGEPPIPAINVEIKKHQRLYYKLDSRYANSDILQIILSKGDTELCYNLHR